MTQPSTGDQHDPHAWHDNLVYGMHFFRQGWESCLVLDIDHIAEWLCGVNEPPRFRVAPATLLFRDVTDLKIDADWGGSGFQVALFDVSIDRVERERIEHQKICLDRPYYRWRILLNSPRAGRFVFGASGFLQELRSPPAVSDQQRSPAAERSGCDLAAEARRLLKTRR